MFLSILIEIKISSVLKARLGFTLLDEKNWCRSEHQKNAHTHSRIKKTPFEKESILESKPLTNVADQPDTANHLLDSPSHPASL